MIAALVDRPNTVDIPIVNLHATNGCNVEVPEGALQTVAERRINVANLVARLVDPGVQYELEVSGGDGTVGWAVEAAVDSGQQVNINLKKNGGGYKKDVATMVEQAGGLVEAKPLVLERKEGDEWIRERMGVYSVGLGKIAVGAKIANSQEEFRAEKSRLIEKIANMRLLSRLVKPEYVGNKLADLGLVRRLLAPTVTVEGTEYPTHVIINGRKIGALLFSNGQLMSGAMRFWQKLHKPGFVATTVGDGKLSTAFGMTARLLSVDPINDRWVSGSSEWFTVEPGTLAEIDGEDLELQGGTYRVRQIEDTKVTLSTEAQSNKSQATQK